MKASAATVESTTHGRAVESATCSESTAACRESVMHRRGVHYCR